MNEIETARIAEEQNEYEQALQIYQHILQHVPNNQEAWEGIVRMLCALHRGKEAVIMADRYISQYPNDIIGKYWKGEGLVCNGYFDEALPLFDDILSEHPNYVPAWIEKGFICHSLTYTDRSKQCYETALHHDHQNADAWVGVGDCFIDMGLLEEGKEAYEKAICLNPRQAWARIGLAISYYRMQQKDQAQAMYQHMIEDHIGIGRAQALLGEIERERGNIEKAIQFFEQAIVNEPYEDLVFDKFADLYYYIFKDYEKAIELYKKSFELFHLDWYLVWEGVCYRKLGKEEQAIQMHRQVIARHPQTMPASASWCYIGEIEEGHDRGESALEAYRQARLAYPQNETAWWNWMVYVANHGGTNEEILNIIEQGLAVSYQFVGLWIDRAEIMRIMGNLDLAQKSLEMAKANGGEACDYYWKAMAFLKEADGRRSEAIPLMEEARKRDPKNTSYVYNLGHFHAQEGHLEEARTFIDQFVEMEPEGYDGWNLREWIYRELGEEKEAKRSARKAKALQRKQQQKDEKQV